MRKKLANGRCWVKFNPAIVVIVWWSKNKARILNNNNLCGNLSVSLRTSSKKLCNKIQSIPSWHGWFRSHQAVKSNKVLLMILNRRRRWRGQQQREIKMHRINKTNNNNYNNSKQVIASFRFLRICFDHLCLAQFSFNLDKLE